MLNHRVTAAVLAAGALVIPAVGLGLGLGEARVESFLNQPLDVRMRLLDVREQDLESLTVRIAAPEDFQRLGLMSDALALNLEVAVDRSASPPVIRVVSRRTVRDPVVQLLIDARWSGGRMLREYTLFLDPATVAVAPPPAAAAPASRESTPSAPAQAPARPASQPERRPAPATPRVQARGDGRYGPVASGDTLWSIARANLPAEDISMNQMMVAIVDLNPNAFRDGNINWLLRGAELTLPSAEQARALDAQAAAVAVAAQNRAFARAAGRQLSVVSDAGRDDGPEVPGRPSTSADTAAADSRREREARLSLVPPDDGADEGAGDGSQGQQIRDLQQRLARAEEELYAARQESEEFQARVEELERVLEARREQGVGVRDAELASLEQTLREAREAGREDADPAVREAMSDRLDSAIDQASAGDVEEAGAGNTADAAGLDDTIGAAPETQAETAADGVASTDPAGPEDGDEATPTTATTEVGSGSRGLFGNPFMLAVIGLALLVLVALGAAFVLRRRSAGEVEAPRPLKRASEMPRPAADPVRTARDRVRANPADLAAHHALLETLADDRRRDDFAEAFEAMFEHVDDEDHPQWRKALDLAGRIIPGHGLVKGSADWVADSGPADSPRSELEEESEVDDLMSRLDADFDEDDDRDWIQDEQEAADDDAKSDTQSPLLRDIESAPESAEPGSRMPDDGDGVDFSEWLDENEDQDEGENEDGMSPGDTEVLETSSAAGDADTEVLDESDSGQAGAGDTPDADDEWGLEAPDEASTLSGSNAEDAADDSDAVFSQSDDDTEVKLDLARAYVSWNSTDSARTLLEEVLHEGNEAQKEEARRLLGELD